MPSSPRILRSTATTLEVAIPGVQATLPGGYLLPSAYVPTPIVTVIGGETVLKFTFPRATGVQIANEGNTVLLNFLRPNIGRAGLAGRVIVIDPGHGGKDSGSATGGIQEKNITLAVSRAVADELAKAGATVVMTRQTDVFIPLLKRNEIAAHNNAEFFVSIHVNQTSGARSGSLAFYHGSDPVSRLLGQALLEQLAQNSGIPTIGTWSDLRLYDTGLSVLRNSRIPAVLLELGFISNQSDRQKMVAADFPGRIAKALVQGFRTYLGDARE